MAAWFLALKNRHQLINKLDNLCLIYQRSPSDIFCDYGGRSLW
ncbi:MULTISPECIES: hypothetical protein [Nostocaceae]|nr:MULTISPECIES: hypothetical protein [Nostocaceae]